MNFSTKNKFLGLCLGALLGTSNVVAQEGYTPSEGNLKARQEFSDSKLGIFLHWGIYSMFAQGEWYMNDANLDCHEYAKVASGFYPSKFMLPNGWLLSRLRGLSTFALLRVITMAFPCLIQNIPTMIL